MVTLAKVIRSLFACKTTKPSKAQAARMLAQQAKANDEAWYSAGGSRR